MPEAPLEMPNPFGPKGPGPLRAPPPLEPVPTEMPPLAEPVPVIAPGGATVAGTILRVGMRILGAAGTIISFGATFHGDCSLPEVPSAVELDRIFVQYTRNAYNTLRELLRHGDFSYIEGHEPGLYQRILELMQREDDTTASKLMNIAIGRAVEAMVAERLSLDDRAWIYFEHVGGAHQPDFIGHGPLEGMAYEITTPKAVRKHLERWYGENLRIVTHDGLDGIWGPTPPPKK